MASGLDEDTLRTLQSGRETAGTALRGAQKHLQKVFLVWVFGLLATISILQNFLWDQLRRDLLYDKMPPDVAEQTVIIAVTPFDVILLQVKIGAVVGILLALPVLIFLSRHSLRERGWWPADKIPAWKLAGLFTVSVLLFCGGVLYSYELFFPLMFSFLAGNALNAGFQPNYSIVMWVQFVVLLGTSFGLAAQLPLLMSALSYSGIVPYETFRDKWKYAIAIIFGFGALFSPPDPFTQVMWALPLCGLYAVSLGIAKLLVLTKRAGEEVAASAVARDRWNVLAGTVVLFGVLTYYVIVSELFTYIERGVDFASSRYAAGDVVRPTFFGLPVETSAAIVGLGVGLVAALAVLYYYMIQELDVAAAEAGNFGDPTAIDVGSLSAGAVRAAPREPFAEMSETDALQLADRAMSEDDPEKARAILDRYDQAHPDGDEAEDAAAGDATEAAGDAAGDEGNVVTRTTAGMFDAFTEDDTTEDDIGGYYYDIAFILDSLTSKAIWFVGLFALVASAVFVFLYQGGIGTFKNVFVGNLPPEMQADVLFINLHPVEHLVFIVKFSAVVGAVATIPLIAYFAWPALSEREFVSGDRGVFGVWGVTVILTLVVGCVVGFLYVGPTVISWLAYDVLQAGMVISYRVGKFGWLIIGLTVGLGVLAEIPVTMVLFHRAGVLPFQTIKERWRGITVGVFVFSALFSPKGIWTMFLVAIPITVAFLVGLGLLWVYTLGGRRAPKSTREPAD